MTTTTEGAATTADEVKFSMRGLPLLESGATMASLGIAPALWAHSKVYSHGGENKLHSHDLEDHCFLVLQGAATFSFGDGSTLQVRAFDGVVLPRGTNYCFVANAGDNLVMFRVGSANVKNAKDIDPRYGMPVELMHTRSRTDGTQGDPAQGGAHAAPTVFKAGVSFPSA